MSKTLITNARLVNDGAVSEGDLLIDGEKLAARADATFRTLRRPQKQG